MKLLLLVLLASCGKHDESKQQAPVSMPIIPEDVRTKICNAEPCGGEMSSIDVYRDDKGAVKKLYRLYGRCSHNAGIYFDPDGTQTEIIPEKPIVPGSDEAKEIDAKHQAQVGGLRKTDTVSCRR
jgi:hypothetical protein